EMLLGSELKEISRRRKASLNLDSEDTGKMLRDVTRNLPMSEALTKILRQTFDLPSPDQSGSAKREPDKKERAKREPRDVPPFHPQRYPSTFRVKGGDAQEQGLKLFQLPQGGSRVISFATDVENDYFDRT